MSEETYVEELYPKRAYKRSIGSAEIVAMKLEGYKASEVGGAIFSTGAEVKAGKAETNDWLVVVKDPRGIVQPMEGWVKNVSNAITDASGNEVQNVSVVIPAQNYEVKIIDNEEDLARAYAEGWSEPYQFDTGKWILRKPGQK